MNKIIGIKAISFDADGTLWDFEKVMRHSLHHVLIELKKLEPNAADMLDIDKMIKIRNRVANELKGRITNLEDIRLEAFRQTLKCIGKPNDALASHLNQVYLKHRFEDMELFDDVLPTLNELRAKYTLGILSNGNSYPERCGLESTFQFVIFSQDYGVEKPNPRLFQIAVEKARCSKQQLLHVGDSLQNDVMGAINAGIKSVWL
ncbi:MAG: HAD family hydrolase, partial [Candidatus Poribacteria bacterium]